jgi:arginyl-tRNA synthetase
MTLAKPLRKRPTEIAGLLRDRMRLADAGVERVEIAGPGFMNFFLQPSVIAEAVREIVANDAQFGRSEGGQGRAVNVEFVSANPTGPLHVGHGRQAALGDAISTLLEWTGWNVSREFYYNDAGVQIENLAASVKAWLIAGDNEPAIPEGGYHGEYIREIAERFRSERDDAGASEDSDAIRHFAVADNM